MTLQTKWGLIVNWQLGLAKVDDAFPTDGFLTFGHNKRIIDRAIEEIDNLNTYNEDEMIRYVSHLSYCQFHIDEMKPDREFLQSHPRLQHRR